MSAFQAGESRSALFPIKEGYGQYSETFGYRLDRLRVWSDCRHRWWNCCTTCETQSSCSVSKYQFCLCRWLTLSPMSRLPASSSPNSSSMPFVWQWSRARQSWSAEDLRALEQRSNWWRIWHCWANCSPLNKRWLCKKVWHVITIQLSCFEVLTGETATEQHRHSGDDTEESWHVLW